MKYLVCHLTFSENNVANGVEDFLFDDIEEAKACFASLPYNTTPRMYER